MEGSSALCQLVGRLSSKFGRHPVNGIFGYIEVPQREVWYREALGSSLGHYLCPETSVFFPIVGMAALPGINSYISISSGSISCLLMTKPTPAIARGVSGCAELRILRFFSKLLSSLSSMFWSRCDSCIFMFSEGAAAPFTFCDVIRMLALNLAFFGGWVHSGAVLGARWVPFWVPTRVGALVGVSGFRALSGMSSMHGQRRGGSDVQGRSFWVYSSISHQGGNALNCGGTCPSVVG